MKITRNRLAGAASLAMAGLVCFVAVGAALVSQYAFAMQPCAWCVLQRAIFLCIGVACLVAAACKQGIPQSALKGFGLILAFSGMASALWQHFQAAASSSCKLSLADKIVGKWLHLSELVPFVFEPLLKKHTNLFKMTQKGTSGNGSEMLRRASSFPDSRGRACAPSNGRMFTRTPATPGCVEGLLRSRACSAQCCVRLLRIAPQAARVLSSRFLAGRVRTAARPISGARKVEPSGVLLGSFSE